MLKQARGTLILPNQGLCWHIPSVVSLLLFYPLLETERQSGGRQGRDAWLALLTIVSPLAGHATLNIKFIGLRLVELLLYSGRSLITMGQAMQ